MCVRRVRDMLSVLLCENGFLFELETCCRFYSAREEVLTNSLGWSTRMCCLYRVFHVSLQSVVEKWSLCDVVR
jgi:hypothetical protein